MIELSKLEPFAIGGRRQCYIHPEFPGICLKIARPECSPDVLAKQSNWLRRLRKIARGFDENMNDWKVLSSLQKAGSDEVWAHLPALKGWMETDRGRALAMELIRDYDGLISRSLLDWINTHGSRPCLFRAIDDFCRFWESQTIPSRSLGLHNIVMQEFEPGSYRLVFIDGFGSTSLIPWSRLGARGRARAVLRKTERLRKEVSDYLAAPRNPRQRGVLLKRN